VPKWICCIAAVLAAQGALADPVPSPLRPVGGPANGAVTLALDAEGYAALQPLQHAALTGFVLPDGRLVDLSLDRFDIFTADARVVTAGVDGEADGQRPDIQLWRGTVEGDPESYAYLALLPQGSCGYVHTRAGTSIISSGPAGQWPTVIYDLAGPAGKGIRIDVPQCAGALLVDGDVPPSPTGPYSPRTYTCRRFRIAVDCDTEFTGRFGGNMANAQAYATALFGAVSEIYNRDMSITLEVSYLRTWGPGDPYTGPDTSSQLPQFRDYWQDNMESVEREMAHMLSGRSLGGGIAYLRQPCGGYAVSANINGFFPYPLQDNHWQNWDVMVVAHEQGHNLGTGHTHDLGSYNPIVDGCGSSPQDCSNANQGTIMSYCHTCSGGMSNIRLTFGTRVSEAVRSYLDTSARFCGSYITSATFTQNPQSTQVGVGEPAGFSAVVTGEVTGYQWQKNNVDLVNDGRISGVTTPTFSISTTLSTDSGTYKLVAMTSCGPQPSLPAVLAFDTCPTIYDHPQDASVALGAPVVMAIDAGGTWPRSYQWRRNGQPLSDGPRVLGATSYTVTINPVEAGDAGAYDCIVTNNCGSLTSDTGQLTITGICGSADFNGDGDIGTDGDIEAFFACLAGNCCGTCGSPDFNGDGDIGTDADMEGFFRVLSGGEC
jgi:hypothetical protein